MTDEERMRLPESIVNWFASDLESEGFDLRGMLTVN